MALTRITKGVIKPNENYDTHNINSTGIVTAIGLDINGNADISGNMSVGGALTYEDVTSIDSVGIITAQKDIHVGAGVSAVGVGTFGSLDIGGDIDVDGHTELDRMKVTGVATFTNFIEAGSVGSGGIKVGSNLFIQDQANVLIQNTGNGSMYLKSLGTSLRDRNNNTIINVSEALGARLYHTGGSTQKLGTSATGINILEDLDVDGHTNLDNVSIAGITTHNEDVWFKGATSNRDAYWDKSANTLYFKDNARIYLGDSSDFRIYHTPNSGAYGGANFLGANGHPIYLMTSMNGSGENGIHINPNSDVKLFYDNSAKLETSQKGIKVGTGVTIETNGQGTFSGIVTSRGYEVSYSDGPVTYNYFKAGRITIFDNGSHCHFRGGSHPSYAPNQRYFSSVVERTNGYYLQNTAATRYAITWVNNDGPVNLWYSKGYAPDYSIKLSTTAKGITVGAGVTIETNGQATFSGISTFSGDVAVYGSKFKLPLGTSNPSSPITGDSYYNTAAGLLKIYDGSNWGSVLFAAAGTQQNPATSASNLGATGAIATYYFSPDGGTAFQHQAAGGVANFGTIPSGGPSWVYSHNSCILIDKLQVGTARQYAMSQANFLKFIAESITRTGNTPYIYWAAFDTGTLWGIWRIRWTGATYSSWVSNHDYNGSGTPPSGTPSSDVWKTGSGTTGNNLATGTYTVSNDTNLDRAVLPFQAYQSGGAYGIHYKRFADGEHYPWRDSSGNCTSNGYFRPSSSYSMGTDTRYSHYIYIADS